MCSVHIIPGIGNAFCTRTGLGILVFQAALIFLLSTLNMNIINLYVLLCTQYTYSDNPVMFTFSYSASPHSFQSGSQILLWCATIQHSISLAFRAAEWHPDANLGKVLHLQAPDLLPAVAISWNEDGDRTKAPQRGRGGSCKRSHVAEA